MTDVVKVGEKGQITIPKKIREKEGLKKGESLEVKDLGEGTILLTNVDKKKEAEIAFKLLGKEVDFSDKEEVTEYCKKIRKDVYEEWENQES